MCKSVSKETLILTNAAVYTVDANGTTADTVVIRDGAIAYVGSADGAKAFRSDDCRVIDAHGGTVLPGMVDSHMHPAMSAVQYYFEIGLQDGFSVEEYEQIIRDFVAEHPDLEIYAGACFMRSCFDAVGPRKETLDAICPNKPMLIQSVDGHSYWINSKAMELAGITKETPDPEGGIIQRDPETGEPSGLLLEAAMSLIDGLMPHYTRAQYKEALLWMQGWMNERGITTIYDALVPLDNENYYMAYQELAEEGKLTVRIRGAWMIRPGLGDREALLGLLDRGIALSKTFTTDWFQINSFKFYADQVLEEETAYLSAPYSSRSDGWRGIKVWDEALLEELMTKADAAGFQVHIHQIGDSGASYVLDILERVRAANGVRDSRHTMAHVQFLSDADRQRLADLKMNALIAPYWFAMDDYYWDLTVPSIGRERANQMYPAKSLFDAGINVGIHSDFSVTEPEWGWLLYAATTRALPQRIFDLWYEGKDFTRTADPKAEVFDGMIGPLQPHEERLTLAEIVKAATYNGAYTNFLEREVGSIEVGKRADLVLMDMDMFAEDLERVADVTPVMTVSDGRVVFEK